MSSIIQTFPQIYRSKPSVLQINTGKKCNQRCTHCHVSAGPERKEDLSMETAEKIITAVSKHHFDIADITGGAPEMNATFSYLLESLTELTNKVIVRCNLTVALSKKQLCEEIFTKHKPVIVASMPCYEAKNVDKQRGDGVFDKSIRALQWLNELGFGKELDLTLVYNPTSPILPPDEKELEMQFKKNLREKYAIEFTNLIAIANVPVGRYLDYLNNAKLYPAYMNLLKENFNASTIETLMCRNHINIDWQGNIFDCDFNQQLELHPFKTPTKIWDLDMEAWEKQDIIVADHCFTCTAGNGSSCGGSLS